MYRYFLFVVLFCLSACAGVTAQGIRFCATYEEARQLATEQRKLLFIDFYTSWCGPCKMMLKEVFPQQEVGDYFNAHFVCCKVNAEKEGKMLAQKYKVGSYPTLLYLNETGEVVHKTVGSTSADGLLEEARKALAWKDSSGNLANLKKEYVSHRKDEDFLKRYIGRLAESKEPVEQPIEDYLEVQTAMREDSEEMMRFLMKHSKHLVLGGNADRILQENMAVYMGLLNDMQKQILKNLPETMAGNTRKMALKQKDVALYRLFLDFCEKHSAPFRDITLKEARMELLLLEGKTEEYKRCMTVYIDSIMKSRKVKQIQQADRKAFESYERLMEQKGQSADHSKEKRKTGEARAQMKKIIALGADLLRVADISDARAFDRWLKYGKSLLAEDYAVLNFEANVLYKWGRKEEAVSIKRKAGERVPSYMKAYTWIGDELKSMEENTFTEGRVILP